MSKVAVPLPDPKAARLALVVDDDEDVRAHVRTLFESEGYTVLTATGALDAFAIWQRERMDLIVTDVRMGGGGAEHLLACLADDGEEMPVILCVTGHSDLSLEDAFDKGVSAIFTKPFAVNDLLGAARHFLRLVDRRRTIEYELKRSQTMLQDFQQKAAPSVAAVSDGPVIDPGFLILKGLDDRTIALTPTELKMVTIFTQAPEATVPKTTIIRQIWGSGPYGAKTFSVHLHRLRKKLHGSGFDIIYLDRDVYRLCRSPHPAP